MSEDRASLKFTLFTLVCLGQQLVRALPAVPARITEGPIGMSEERDRPELR